MNDTPSTPGPAAPSPVEVPTGLYSQRRDVSTMSPELVQAEYRALGKAQDAPGRLDRLEALAKRLHGGDTIQSSPGGVLKGDASAGDPTSDPIFKRAISGELGNEERQNAQNYLDRHNVRAQQADVGMTEAEFAQMEAAAAPKSVAEYRDIPSGNTVAKALFEAGASPDVVNLYSQVGDKIWALPDDAFSAKTMDARAAAIALPRGAQAVAEAADFIRGLPDDSPALAAAILATTTAQGIFELSRIARARKAAS